MLDKFHWHRCLFLGYFLEQSVPSCRPTETVCKRLRKSSREPSAGFAAGKGRISELGLCRGGSNPFYTTNCGSLCFHSAALGEFVHPCEDDIVCKCTTEENKVPYFNAPVYLENKEQIGKVDEIFGQLRDFVSFLLSSF